MPLQIPQQELFSPVTNYYKGKAIRQDLATAKKQEELLDLKIAEAKKPPQVDQKELDRRSEFTRDALAEASAAAVLQAREGAPPEEYTATFNATLAQALGPEATAAMQQTWDRNGDGVLGESEIAELESFAIARGQELQGGDERTTLTSEEAMSLPGMTKSRAENAVIQRDEKGQIFIDDAPTGLTEGDLKTRGGVNASGISKNTIEFQDSVIGAVGAVQTANELLISADTNPEALGVPGGMMRFGSNLISGAKAIADWAGYEKLSLEDTEKQTVGSSAFNYDSLDTDKLGVSGAEAEKFRAGVYGIAFAAAVAEQGTRPTDKDIQQFIDQIGGRATSAQSFRETIAQFMRRQDRRIKTIADVKQIGEADRDAALSAWKPSFRAFMETYAKTSGRATATNPETGERFIEMSPGNWEEF